MNKFIFSGNLTRDPDFRTTKSGYSVAKLSIAVGFGDSADFFNLIAWNKTAELANQFLRKGSKILVSGRVKNNSYEKDGAVIKTTDFVVDNLEFLDSKKTKPSDNSSSAEYIKPDYADEEDVDVPF